MEHADGIKELSWEAPDFIYHEKDVSWYWLSIIIATLLAAYGLWQKNFLFILFVVVAEIIIIGWARKWPTLFHFLLNERGVSINNKEISLWSELENFAILEMEEISEIALKKDGVASTLKLFAPNEKLKEIKDFLTRRLPETDHDESLIESISRAIKF